MFKWLFSRNERDSIKEKTLREALNDLAADSSADYPVGLPRTSGRVGASDVIERTVGKAYAALGRQTYPNNEYLSGTVGSNRKIKVLKPLFESTIFSAVDTLSIANPDVSQMINNIIQLGNTGHFVEILGSQKRQVKRAVERLNEKAKTIYPISAGVDGLVNDLLGQQARTGALSAEIVMNDRLSDGVKEIVIVPVSTIRFAKDETDRIFPVQYLGEIKNRTLELVYTDYIILNENTYSYYKLDSLEGSPYAIPPVIAALNNIQIQMSMMKNLSAVTRKVGLVGFISILLKAPTINKGESRDAYKTRMRSYLEDSAQSLTSNYNDGIFVGFKDLHEVKHESLTADLRGLQGPVQINEEQIFSGLKSDPAMHGRTYSTTETYAGVVFDKLLAQLNTNKRLVKRFLERVYYLELASQGITVDKVKVTFKEAKPLNELAEQQAIAQKFTNYLNQLKLGVIDWQEFCRKMGTDTPAKEEPDFEALNPAPKEPAGEAKPKEKKEKPKKKNVLDNMDGTGNPIYRGVLDVREDTWEIGELK